MNLKLTEGEFRAEHQARPGLIPVELDTVQRTASWLDLNDYHCFEGSFRRSLATYNAILAGAPRPSEPWRCISSLDFLRSAPPATDCLSPSGFILHAGRCGSTLLAKVLARSVEHLVFGEGGPHNQIWPLINASPDQAPLLFRNLILHTARPRRRSYKAHVVKFTSFNVMRLETIHAAFPDVPIFFLFRHPAQMLASWRRGKPGWMGMDTGIGTIWHAPERAISDFFQRALRAGDRMQLLDYADLSPRMLPAILDAFHLDPSVADRELMQAEFTWDAKSNRAWAPHPSTSAGSGPPAPAELLELYRELTLRKIRC
ncbi:MAG TPA: hypothetical protein VN519_01320 [Bryobacteraceae bacterium]|nr:hypothetical protein [Bryobacteraceae bacterium]